MKLLFRLLLNALALLLITRLVEGFHVDSLYFAIIASIVLGLVNAIIRPLIYLLTLPINLVTLGLFTFVINAALIWFVSTFLDGFEVTGFLPALLAAIILWIVSFATNALLKNSKKKRS